MDVRAFILLQTIAATVLLGSDPAPKAHAEARMLLWLFVLLIVFMVGSYALVRFSRRYRRHLLRPTAPPTDSSDVWKMHRLPEKWDETGGEEPMDQR